jgi:hypothetical protein
MARTNQKRGAIATVRTRNTTGGNSGAGAGLKTYLMKTWSGLQGFGCTQADIEAAASEVVTYAQAMTVKLCNPEVTAAPTVQNNIPQQRKAPAAPQPRKARTPMAGTAGMDLNKAILSVMPDTGPIQQSKIVQTVQAKYPNRWKGNIIGAGLGRFLKAGTLVRQGGTGNKAVWALARSQTTAQQQAA